MPVGVKKLLSVNKEFEWTGSNLEQVFELTDKLGEG
jgi:hypothetical protein